MTDVNDEGPSVVLRGGENIEADLIVAADGTLQNYRNVGCVETQDRKSVV